MLNCGEDKRLRIAVFNYHLPRAGFKRGGVDRVAHELANGLARRGHQVTVVTYDPKPPEAVYNVAPLPFKRFGNSWLGFRLMSGYLGNFLLLSPVFRSCDVIIAMGDSILSPLVRQPVVRVMLGSALGEALSAKTPWRFVMQLGVYIQELITPLISSDCIAISHNTVRYNPFIRRIIPLGASLEYLSSNASSKTAEPSILFVGVLNGRKRGQLLVKWFQRDVKPFFPTASLMMVSPAGPPVEGVKYYCGISNTELADLYRRAWIYASPSTYEGFGLPYLEAMASGTPVIATPNVGSREVLDNGRYGLLVEDEKFGQAMVELLTDAEKRKSLAEKGLERAKEYSLELMIDRYEELLLKLCSHTNGLELSKYGNEFRSQ